MSVVVVLCFVCSSVFSVYVCMDEVQSNCMNSPQLVVYNVGALCMYVRTYVYMYVCTYICVCCTLTADSDQC